MALFGPGSEELRPIVADRLVLTRINNRQVKAPDFLHMESGVRKQPLSSG